MLNVEQLKQDVEDQISVMTESGGDLNGYIKRFGDETGRNKYAADTAVLKDLRESLHEVVTDLVLAELLGD